MIRWADSSSKTHDFHDPHPLRGAEEGGRLRLAALVEQRRLGPRVACEVVHTWGGRSASRGRPGEVW